MSGAGEDVSESHGTVTREQWMGRTDDGATICGLCDWWFPLHDGEEPIDEWLWKACAVLHGLLLHPKEHHEATGYKAEERLAMYEEELGTMFDPIRRFALGEHLDPADV